MQNYEIKDWSKFDYLTVEIPTSAWVGMLITVLVLTGGWATFAMMNNIDKDNDERKLLGKKPIKASDDYYTRPYYKRTGSFGPK
jgi:hypothetical protein